MKKINLLAVVVAGVFVAACNGGGSGSSGDGGNNSGGGGAAPLTPCTSGTTSCGTPSGQVVEKFEAVLPSASLPQSSSSLALNDSTVTIVSTTNLYLSSQESSYVTFQVIGNITQPFIMDFYIQPDDASNQSKPKFIHTTSTGQSNNQCRFPDNSGSQICTLSIDPNNAINGKYKILGQVNYNNQPFEINIVANYFSPTVFDLPLGTYNRSYTYADKEDGCIQKQGSDILVNVGEKLYACESNYYGGTNVPACILGSQEQLLHMEMPSQSFKLQYNLDQLVYYSRSNISWNNGVLFYNEVTSDCPSFIGSSSIVFQSSSTELPYPALY